MLIDDLAYKSPYKNIDPREKFCFSLFTIFTILFWNRWEISLLCLIIFSFFIIKSSGSLKDYLKLLYYPSFFLLLSSISLKLGNIDNFYIINLIIKSYGLILAINYLFITTTIIDISSVLEFLYIPKFFIELFNLIYRYIFYIFEIRDKIKMSQLSRAGYNSYFSSLKDFSILISAIFIHSFKKVETVKYSLISRNYNGELHFISRKKDKNIFNYLYILIWIILLNLLGGFIW